MQIAWQDNLKLYVARHDFRERHVLKKAGFRFNRKKMWWATPHADSAAQLLQHISDPPTLGRIYQEMRLQSQSFRLSSATAADFHVPAPEGYGYDDYQLAAIQYASLRDGTLISDEMGLGKTIEAIGFINHLGTRIRNGLIVAPASLKDNWATELERWLCQKFSVGVAHGSKLPNTDLIIINYDILDRHPVLQQRAFDVIIADEIHRVKAGYRKSKSSGIERGLRNKAFQGLMGLYRLGLTGTPIKNGRPKELYEPLDWLQPGKWGSFFDFALRYCGAYQGLWGWNFDGATHLDELQYRLRSHVMVRRLKSQVLSSLPPKRRQIIQVQPRTKAERQAIEEEWNAWEKEEARISELHAKAETLEGGSDLRAYKQAVQELKRAITVAQETMAERRIKAALAKIPYVVDRIKDAIGETKVLVFCHHREVSNKLMAELGDIAVKVTGEVPSNKRQPEVDRFEKDDSVRVLVGSYGAASEGYNMNWVGLVIALEYDWVPGTMTQSEDRAHRRGKEDSLLVQHIVLAGSFDVRMATELVKKQEINDQALDEKLLEEELPVLVRRAA